MNKWRLGWTRFVGNFRGDIFLSVVSCIQGRRQIGAISEQQAELEALTSDSRTPFVSGHTIVGKTEELSKGT